MTHLQGTWDVVEIAYAELPDHAIVTIEISPGEMQGKAACSYYRAPLAIEGDRLNKGEIERSGHECDMELEEAEANFMRVLEIVDRFEIDAEGDLTLLAQTSPMIRAIPRAPE